MSSYWRPASIHNWWSDSNSIGATVDLHALAKPLSRLLHRRQVLGIISQGPLSSESVDALMSYLESKEISTSMKLLILGDLSRADLKWGYSVEILGEEDNSGAALRQQQAIVNSVVSLLETLPLSTDFLETLMFHVEKSLKTRIKWDTQARTMGHQLVIPVLICLLDSPEIRLMNSVRLLLATWPLSKQVLNVLISYLENEETPASTQVLIMEDLSVRAEWEAHARNLGKEDVFPILLQLLGSPETRIVETVCILIGTLSTWKSVTEKILLMDSDVCRPLLTLANPSRGGFHKEAIYALSRISTWENDDVATLAWICRILGNFARFGTIAVSVESSLYMRLDVLLDQEEASHALTCIREASEAEGSVWRH
ncbi:hypothetical protein GGX14DRAFT_575141 [Mycena pura]|uniref:Uncharacterized protein n=1 Tax=Mycena pura TaxID=153505 RepID=A0AAD6Y667_9AGAR|nr:hypothetical protein GGX14DRAFT_575141 [Mycena pura]